MNPILNPIVLVQPSSEVLSLREVKQFLRIEHSAEDAVLMQLIKAAREAAQSYLNLTFITQSWQYQVRASESFITLPMKPVRAITQVEQRDDGGIWTIIPASDYMLDQDALVLTSSVTHGALLRIAYSAGMAADASLLPAAIKQALLEHVVKLYESRGLEQPLALHEMYAPLREVRI